MYAHQIFLRNDTEILHVYKKLINTNQCLKLNHLFLCSMLFVRGDEYIYMRLTGFVLLVAGLLSFVYLNLFHPHLRPSPKTP